MRISDGSSDVCSSDLYAQSAIFTPSDFQFPTNAVKAEATPNTEMTLIADVDLDALKVLHQYGTVRTLKDRRKDLYEVNWRSEEHRVGKECVSTCRYRRSTIT